MKKFHIWFWLIKGFFQKHKKIMFLGNIIGIVIAIFVIWVLPYIPRPNPITKIGIIGQYSLNELPEFVTSKIGQGLTATLEDGSVVGALAQDWSISDDKLTYTFFLREKLFWQDDSKVKAQDLNYVFSDVVTKVLDENTIQFTLKDKYSPFPVLLTKPALKNSTIGTSDFRIRNIKYSNGYIQNLTLDSSLETIIIKFYPSLNIAKTAFKLGEINEIVDLYENPYIKEQDWQNNISEIGIIDYSQYLGLFINNSNEILKDKSFRQSLAYATKKSDDSSRAFGPINPKSWAYNKDLKPYLFNPTRAQELMEKSLGNLSKAKDITLTLSTTQVFLPIAEQIKKDWEETLGLQIQIQVINTINPNYQILLASQEIPPDPDQYSLWHSTQSQNFINFKNPRIDKLLEDARQEEDKELRKEQYVDFQRFFVEESPIIFIEYPRIYSVKRKSVVQPFINYLLQIGRK